jgi:putative ABC transport system ATP-binding protein
MTIKLAGEDRLGGGTRPADGGQGVLVELREVSRTYQMGDVTVRVLRDVDLKIHDGEFLVVVGPSGSGKTTLLNLVGGLDQPTSGNVWSCGRDLSALSTRELTLYRRHEIGFVFQFFNLVPSLTALENISVATEICDHPRPPDEALRAVGLEERTDHFPSQLSGGEQQRVAIARALAKNPRLLLCDEPTGALDYETGKSILGALWDVNRRTRKTVVVITHNLAIGRMADRLVRLRSGQIVEDRSNPEPAPAEEISW